MDPKFANDNGYASRKLWFSMFCVAAILVAGKWLAIAAVGEATMGIVMVCSIYVAGNAVIKWKNASVMKDQPPEEGEAKEGEAKETEAKETEDAPKEGEAKDVK
jgi:hypothetical protein